MVFDPRLGQLFIANFREAHRTAIMLAASIERVSSLLPLSKDSLDNLDFDDKDKLDAFRVRFYDLQDTLGAKVFRGIVILEEEQTGSQLDIINKIAKRGIIDSFDYWKRLREIRNLFSHEYPEKEDERTEALNQASQASKDLLTVIDNLNQYVRKHFDLPMNEFEFITN